MVDEGKDGNDCDDNGVPNPDEGADEDVNLMDAGCSPLSGMKDDDSPDVLGQTLLSLCLCPRKCHKKIQQILASCLPD